jgi:TRAP-type C4-dicarboxylate transport system substrate-binding protein
VPLVYPVQANKSWWEGLTAAQRSMISKAIAATEQPNVKDIEDSFKRDIQIAEKRGDKVYRPSKAELDQWKEETAMARKAYISQAGATGQTFLDDVAKSLGKSG